MEDSSGLRIHALNSPIDWPAAVQPIVDLVTEHLPLWVAHGPHPQTAPISTSLVSDLKKIAIDIMPSADPSNDSYLQLRGNFDLVMSSCADLRTLASMTPMEPVLGKNITFGLVAALLRTFSEDLIPRKHAQLVDGETAEFLLVQTMTHEDFAVSEARLHSFLQSDSDEESHTEDDAVDDQAWVFERSEGDQSHGYLNASDEALQNVPIVRRRGSSWYDESEYPPTMTVRSRLSPQPSLASLDVPGYTHILRPSSAYIDVPVICMTEAATMPSTISKLLHQRQLFGINEPVIGFIVSSDGSMVQLAIGWTNKDGIEPISHWATSLYGAASSPYKQLGVYNLTNPLECILFAALILGLHDTLRTFSNTLQVQARKVLSVPWSWSTKTSRVVVSKEKYIKKWCLDVAQSVQLSVDAPISSTDDADVKGIITPPASVYDYHFSSDASKELSRNVLISTNNLRHTNSRRCQIRDFTDDKGGTVMDSLLDRGIFTVPHVTVKISRIPTDLAYAFRCIKSMVSAYDDDTQPRWVKTWQQQTSIPDFEPRFQEYGQELFADTRLRTSRTYLEEDAARALSDHLPGIFGCALLARTLPDLASKRGAAFQAWDQFLVQASLVIGSTSKRLIRFSFRRSINLPVNPYQLQLSANPQFVSDDFEEYLSRLAFIQDVHKCAELEISWEPLRTPGRSARLKRCQAGVQYFQCLVGRIHQVVYTDEKIGISAVEKMIRDRCSVEPLLGSCDAVLAVSCDDVGRQVHEAVFKALYTARPLSAQDVFDESVAMMEDFQLLISSPVKSHTQNDSPHLRKAGRTLPHISTYPRSESCMHADATSFDSLFTAYQSKLPGLDIDLSLPLLFVIFNEPGDPIETTTNHMRNCAAAALKYFDTLGISDEPFYLLVVKRTCGTLFMAMNTQKDRKRDVEQKRQFFILERNVRTYDIASTVDAYELAVFIQTLVDRGRKLKARFNESLLPAFLEQVRLNPDVLKWSMCSWASKEERAEHKEQFCAEAPVRISSTRTF